MNKREAILKLREAQLKTGHLRNTRKTYRGWLVRYIDGAKSGRFSVLQGFLDELSTDPARRVNPKTVRQALNAMVFFYKNVLERDPGKLKVPKVNRNRNEPTWLNHQEIIVLLSRMKGTPRLQAEMLYATGSRINALLTLRLNDLDLQKGLVTFRFDKGGKTRTVNFGNTILPALRDHVEWVKGRWEADHKRGIIAPTDDESLIRKFGRDTFGNLPWYWLFPSQVTRGRERWHATDRGLCKAIAKAAKEAGFMKRVTAHTLRHSHATSLLNRGENIRTIQKQLGHTKVETTEIYTHTTSGPVMSPLDQPNVVPFVAKSLDVVPDETSRIG